MDELSKLKSMAYDQIAIKEEAERNLAALNQKIAELMNNPEDPKQAEKPMEKPMEKTKH